MRHTLMVFLSRNCCPYWLLKYKWCRKHWCELCRASWNPQVRSIPKAVAHLCVFQSCSAFSLQQSSASSLPMSDSLCVSTTRCFCWCLSVQEWLWVCASIPCCVAELDVILFELWISQHFFWSWGILGKLLVSWSSTQSPRDNQS